MLLGGEGLPAIKTHQGGVRTEHGGVGQTEASGTAEHLPSPLLVSPKKQAHLEPGIAYIGFTAFRRHHNQAAIGSQLQHRLTIFGTE
jgi:hypothetical protein